MCEASGASSCAQPEGGGDRGQLGGGGRGVAREGGTGDALDGVGE